MKNNLPLIILIFFCVFVSAQSERRLLIGKVVNDSLSVENIHVINKTTQKAVKTNKEGGFAIPAKIMDTLIFSGVQYKIFYKVISKNDLQKMQVIIKLKPHINFLDEVTIKPISVAKRLNLPNADKKPKTNLEARIDGHSKANVPIMLLQTLIGGAGGIDNLYYVLSGKRKKDRKLQKLIEQDKTLARNKNTSQKIRKHFKEDFFIYELKIPAKEIDNFIMHCTKYNIISLFNEEKLLEVTEILIQQSDIFLKTIKTE